MIGIQIGLTGQRAQAYAQKVLALGPIAYWPLSEASGTVIGDVSGNSRHGVIGGTTPPTFGAAGIGDGRTALSFPGATAFGNLYSAGLAAAFSGSEGTLLAWMRVSGAGVWSDGAVRYVASCYVDANNKVLIYKDAANTLKGVYQAGGTIEDIDFAHGGATGWLSLIITWSKTAETVAWYKNGSALTPDVTLGVWAGNLIVNQPTIGASSVAPGGVWSGSLAHIALWSRPLGLAEVVAVGTPL